MTVIQHEDGKVPDLVDKNDRLAVASTMINNNDVRASDLVSKRILVLAPHMDDETLGCGGTILLHSDKAQVFCLYATDGARSPAPLLPWQGAIAPDIRSRRKNEAREVMEAAGVPPANLVFLDLPDGQLRRHRTELQSRLRTEIARIRPALVLAPFRFDLHTDHVTLYDATRKVMRHPNAESRMLEYFIYYRWRLISAKDIRSLIRPDYLVSVDTSTVNKMKSSLIRGYRTQTEIFNDWQETPILTTESIEQRCSHPEVFLISDPAASRGEIFSTNRLQIVLAHYVERFGKRPKDQALALLRRLQNSPGRHDA